MSDTTNDEAPACLEESPECAGAVLYRESLSGTGTPIPRCAQHWSKRLDREQELRQRYPEQPPADWSPYDAGENWSEDDY